MQPVASMHQMVQQMAGYGVPFAAVPAFQPGHYQPPPPTFAPTFNVSYGGNVRHDARAFSHRPGRLPVGRLPRVPRTTSPPVSLAPRQPRLPRGPPPPRGSRGGAITTSTPWTPSGTPSTVVTPRPPPSARAGTTSTTTQSSGGQAGAGKGKKRTHKSAQEKADRTRVRALVWYVLNTPSALRKLFRRRPDLARQVPSWAKDDAPHPYTYPEQLRQVCANWRPHEGTMVYYLMPFF